jgi:hypothetical protein
MANEVEKIVALAGSLGIELPNALERAIHTAIHDAEADAVQVIGGCAATKRWYGLAAQGLDPSKNWGRTWERPKTRVVEVMPGVTMTPVFKTAEEYEAFRKEYREAVVPTLKENARRRAESAAMARGHNAGICPHGQNALVSEVSK